MDLIKLSENETLKFEYYNGMGERCVYTYTDTDGEVFMTECPNGSEKEAMLEKDQWLRDKEKYKKERIEFAKRYKRFMWADKELAEGEAVWINGSGFHFFPTSTDEYKKFDCYNVYLKYRFHGSWYECETYDVHGKSLEDCIAQIQEIIDSPTRIGDPMIEHIDKSTCRELC